MDGNLCLLPCELLVVNLMVKEDALRDCRIWGAPGLQRKMLLAERNCPTNDSISLIPSLSQVCSHKPPPARHLHCLDEPAHHKV